MELSLNRNNLAGAGGAIAYGLLVAWMVPPTQPHPAGPGWREHVTPMAPPVPVAFAGLPIDPVAPAARIQPVAYQEDDRDQPGDGVSIYRGDAGSQDFTPTAATPPADRDDAVHAATTAAPADYRDGYRWAQNRDLDDPRNCRDTPSDAAQNGCLGYVYDGGARAMASSGEPIIASQDEPLTY